MGLRKSEEDDGVQRPEVFRVNGKLNTQVHRLLTKLDCDVAFPGEENCNPLEEFNWSCRWAFLIDLGYSTRAISKHDGAPEPVIAIWADNRAVWIIKRYGDIDRGLTHIKMAMLADRAAELAMDGIDFDRNMQLAMSAYRQIRQMRGYDAPPVTETRVKSFSSSQSVQVNITEQTEEGAKQRLTQWLSEQQSKMIESQTMPNGEHARPFPPTS